MQGGIEVSSYHVDNIVDMLKICSPLSYGRSSDHHKVVRRPYVQIPNAHCDLRTVSIQLIRTLYTVRFFSSRVGRVFKLTFNIHLMPSA